MVKIFVSPQLLQKSDLPFNDNAYLTELKLDGFRCIYTKFDDKVKIYTRHNNDITWLYPELHNLPISNGTVLDGEIIVTDDSGKPNFEYCMERFRSKNALYEISYCVFDVIYHEGKKVSSLPLIERKALLSKIIPEDTPLFNKVQWIEGHGEEYFELVKQQGLEGTVQKLADSKYSIDKRTNDWLKIINYSFTEAYITGLRKNEFGLLLGVEENGKIKPAGVMEFMNPTARKEFYRQYRDLILEENKDYIFIDPKIKCKVKFRNWTRNGRLRIPSFVEYTA